MKHLKITIGRCRIYGGLFAMVDFVFFHFRNCRDDDDRQIKRKTQIYLLKLFAPSTNTEEHDLRLKIQNKKYWYYNFILNACKTTTTTNLITLYLHHHNSYLPIFDLFVLPILKDDLWNRFPTTQ